MPDKWGRRRKELPGSFAHENQDVGMSLSEEPHVIAVAVTEKDGDRSAGATVTQPWNRRQ
jgi:hypothetical protein